MTERGRRRAIHLPGRAIALPAPVEPLTRQAPPTPQQLLKARLRAARGFLEDVAHDGDLLPAAARQQVFVALQAVSEAIALATATED